MDKRINADKRINKEYNKLIEKYNKMGCLCDYELTADNEYTTFYGVNSITLKNSDVGLLEVELLEMFFNCEINYQKAG